MPTRFSSFIRFIDSLSPPRKAQAHCDIPCGVYETDSMMWAVETVEKLVAKLVELQRPKGDDLHEDLEYRNAFVRAVMVKEEYAQICKEQILILWTDYFKPEHLEKWPELHEKVWMACKQCSVVKRTVDPEAVKKLRTMCSEIAEIFKVSKI